MIIQQHITKSIEKALRGESDIAEDELALAGFSTPTIRMLISNLCEGANIYLEVGVWGGATFCSSFNKDLISIGIDNYSQDFGIPDIKNLMEKGVEKLRHKAKEAVLHYEDFFSFDINKLPNEIGIYYYDGFHGEEAQSKALPYVFDKLANKFLYIVDDFAWDSVFNGTNKGLSELKDKIDIEQVWPLRGYRLQEDPIWHNSMCLYLINKK